MSFLRTRSRRSTAAAHPVLMAAIGWLGLQYGFIAFAAEPVLPEYPEDHNLIDVPVDPNMTLKLLLDGSSVSVTRNETRMVYVLESRQGARNVYYEGFRCSKMQYLSYAFGGADRVLQPIPNAEWRTTPDYRRNNFRSFLLKNYICDFAGNHRPARELVRLAKYGGPRPDPEYE